MDPVSHALFGRLLAGFDRRVSLGPGSRGAFVLGALRFDLDILLVLRGWDVYLNAHQAWTHSLALSPVVGLLVARVVRLVSKSAKFDRVWIAAWIGVVVGDLLFDLVSGSDMQLLWPVVSTRFSPHLLAMSDWLAVGIVVLATAASYRRRWIAAWLTVAAMVLLLSVKAGSQSLGAAHVRSERGRRTGRGGFGASRCRERPPVRVGVLRPTGTRGSCVARERPHGANGNSCSR